MRTTQIVTDIGRKDNANGVCTFLSPESQRQVIKVLKQLNDELGDTIWCMPSCSLHITLCEILQAKTYPEDKELSFQRNLDQYKHALDTVLTNMKPIEILFDRLEASPNAIIIRGSNDTVLNTVRSQLVELLPLPAGTKQPPTILHSTIARFTKELDVSIVESIVGRLQISFSEIITEFQLIHNGSPHMLDYKIASRHSLSMLL